MSEESINIIQDRFPDQSDPKDFVEAHRGSEKREAFADFFQLLLDADNVNELNDSDAKFSVTFSLTPWERLKALITGSYKGDIGPLLSESVGFGVCWHHQDIIQTLQSHSNIKTEENE